MPLYHNANKYVFNNCLKVQTVTYMHGLQDSKITQWSCLKCLRSPLTSKLKKALLYNITIMSGNENFTLIWYILVWLLQKKWQP